MPFSPASSQLGLEGFGATNRISIHYDVLYEGPTSSLTHSERIEHMKIFSRKAFATAAAAAFISTSAFAAPAIAETPAPATVTETANPVTTTPTVTQTVDPRPFNEASSGPEDEDGMDRFSDWMKVVTAVIGILTGLIALATQAQRIFG